MSKGKRGHVPIRMCVGCRKKREKEEMIRFTQGAEGPAVVDAVKKKGRGFYLCPNLTCLKMAQKKGRWVRSLESLGDRYPLLIRGMA